MPTPSQIVESKQLLVEGRDAEKFFRVLLRELSLVGIQVQNFGGNNELGGFLKAFWNAPGFEQIASLGIVRDAETDPGPAFQSVCSALRNAGLNVPQQPMLQQEGHPKITIMILPDAKTPGMLETVLLEAVNGNPVMQCVKAYFDCVQQMGSLPNNMDKARLHAFLASCPKPDLLLGQAADAGYWPWDKPVFDPIKQFLQSL